MDDHEWAAYAVRELIRRCLHGLAAQFATQALEVQRWPR